MAAVIPEGVYILKDISVGDIQDTMFTPISRNVREIYPTFLDKFLAENTVVHYTRTNYVYESSILVVQQEVSSARFRTVILGSPNSDGDRSIVSFGDWVDNPPDIDPGSEDPDNSDNIVYVQLDMYGDRTERKVLKEIPLTEPEHNFSLATSLAATRVLYTTDIIIPSDIDDDEIFLLCVISNEGDSRLNLTRNFLLDLERVTPDASGVAIDLDSDPKNTYYYSQGQNRGLFLGMSDEDPPKIQFGSSSTSANNWNIQLAKLNFSTVVDSSFGSALDLSPYIISSDPVYLLDRMIVQNVLSFGVEGNRL